MTSLAFDARETNQLILRWCRLQNGESASLPLASCLAQHLSALVRWCTAISQRTELAPQPLPAIARTLQGTPGVTVSVL
jgi:hypothetical protein